MQWIQCTWGISQLLQLDDARATRPNVKRDKMACSVQVSFTLKLCQCPLMRLQNPAKSDSDECTPAPQHAKFLKWSISEMIWSDWFPRLQCKVVRVFAAWSVCWTSICWEAISFVGCASWLEYSQRFSAKLDSRGILLWPSDSAACRFSMVYTQHTVHNCLEFHSCWSLRMYAAWHRGHARWQEYDRKGRNNFSFGFIWLKSGELSVGGG